MFRKVYSVRALFVLCVLNTISQSHLFSLSYEAPATEFDGCEDVTPFLQKAPLMFETDIFQVISAPLICSTCAPEVKSFRNKLMALVSSGEINLQSIIVNLQRMRILNRYDLLITTLMAINEFTNVPTYVKADISKTIFYLLKRRYLNKNDFATAQTGLCEYRGSNGQEREITQFPRIPWYGNLDVSNSHDYLTPKYGNYESSGISTDYHSQSVNPSFGSSLEAVVANVPSSGPNQCVCQTKIIELLLKRLLEIENRRQLLASTLAKLSLLSQQQGSSQNILHVSTSNQGSSQRPSLVVPQLQPTANGDTSYIQEILKNIQSHRAPVVYGVGTGKTGSYETNQQTGQTSNLYGGGQGKTFVYGNNQQTEQISNLYGGEQGKTFPYGNTNIQQTDQTSNLYGVGQGKTFLYGNGNSQQTEQISNLYGGEQGKTFLYGNTNNQQTGQTSNLYGVGSGKAFLYGNGNNQQTEQISNLYGGEQGKTFLYGNTNNQQTDRTSNLYGGGQGKIISYGNENNLQTEVGGNLYEGGQSKIISYGNENNLQTEVGGNLYGVGRGKTILYGNENNLQTEIGGNQYGVGGGKTILYGNENNLQTEVGGNLYGVGRGKTVLYGNENTLQGEVGGNLYGVGRGKTVLYGNENNLQGEVGGNLYGVGRGKTLIYGNTNNQQTGTTSNLFETGNGQTSFGTWQKPQGVLPNVFNTGNRQGKVIETWNSKERGQIGTPIINTGYPTGQDNTYWTETYGNQGRVQIQNVPTQQIPTLNNVHNYYQVTKDQSSSSQTHHGFNQRPYAVGPTIIRPEISHEQILIENKVNTLETDTSRIINLIQLIPAPEYSIEKKMYAKLKQLLTSSQIQDIIKTMNLNEYQTESEILRALITKVLERVQDYDIREVFNFYSNFDQITKTNFNYGVLIDVLPAPKNDKERNIYDLIRNLLTSRYIYNITQSSSFIQAPTLTEKLIILFNELINSNTISPQLLEALKNYLPVIIGFQTNVRFDSLLSLIPAPINELETRYFNILKNVLESNDLYILMQNISLVDLSSSQRLTAVLHYLILHSTFEELPREVQDAAIYYRNLLTTQKYGFNYFELLNLINVSDENETFYRNVILEFFYTTEFEAILAQLTISSLSETDQLLAILEALSTISTNARVAEAAGYLLQKLKLQVFYQSMNTIISIIPLPKNDNENKKYSTVKSFLLTERAHDLLSHVDLNIFPSNKSLLDFILKTVVESDVDANIIDAFEYYIDLTERLEAIEFITRKEIKRNFKLTEIFIDTLDLKSLTLSQKDAFKKFFKYISEIKPDAMSKFDSWDQAKTRGQFMKLLFKYLLESLATTPEIRESISVLDSLVQMDGKGALPP